MRCCILSGRVIADRKWEFDATDCVLFLVVNVLCIMCVIFVLRRLHCFCVQQMRLFLYLLLIPKNDKKHSFFGALKNL